MNDTKKESPKSMAQELFHNTKILCERPEGMSYEEYKVIMNLQSKIIRKLFTRKPDRKLMSVLPVKLPKIRWSAPKQKIQTPRKTT